ncbi:hypothetical protein BH10ACI2_BH10ACI2_24030 [soil metagenome]
MAANWLNIRDRASRYGLTLEDLPLDDHDDAVRVFKGVNQIFIGTETAIAEFLDRYEQELPKPAAPEAKGFKE